MRRSRLLDQGREELLVYPSEFQIDSRGQRMLVVSDTPTKVLVTTIAGRSSIAELPGNVTATVVRCFARTAPVGPWARIVFRGEEWDIAVPPRFVVGMSKATSYVEFTIRSRNQLDEVTA